MNLLPKVHTEFSDKEYWEKFFIIRGNKAFDWYGEYLQLCSHLHSYIKEKDKILVPGCGNSTLSADLYDNSFQNITNIDVSEIVIRQMKKLNMHRQNMQFICMDATNMTFDADEFNVILDKGTLDALMPDDQQETHKVVDKYFSELKRVLKTSGRFICISLLQSHILDKFLQTFCDKSWMVRIIRCHDAEIKNAEDGSGTNMPVFIVVATKMKIMTKLVLEVCMAGDKMVRLETPEELKDVVRSTQNTEFILNYLIKLHLDKELKVDLYSPGNNTPRYTLYLNDQKKLKEPGSLNDQKKLKEPGSLNDQKKLKEPGSLNDQKKLKEPGSTEYAVFLVPQRRNSEWLFATPEGRTHLQDQVNASRLVVALLCEGHEFSSSKEVQDELTGPAIKFKPGWFSGQITFMSDGNDVRDRKIVYEGSSEISGDFRVEDVDVGSDVFRQLVFLNNQLLVQSDAKLKKGTQEIDFGHVSLYHLYMCVGAALSFSSEIPKVAVLGLGGGSLCMFLKKCYSNVKVTAVEIDPAMVDVAKNQFQLKIDRNLNVKVQDGLDFLKNESVKVKGDDRYAAVMFDMDSKDSSMGLSCPPKAFLDDAVLELVPRILSSDGHLIVNLVCRDNKLREPTLNTLQKHFKYMATVKLSDEVNEVVFATNREKLYTNEEIKIAIADMNIKARKKNLVKIRCVDSTEFLDLFNVIQQ